MKARVLLADDDSSVLAALTGVLHAEGYDVVHATDGDQAVRHCHDTRPDLVLLDLNMPAQSGWAALEQLSGFDPRPPVVIITARPGQGMRALTAGADALMEKPLDLPLLLRTLEKLLAAAAAPARSRTAIGA